MIILYFLIVLSNVFAQTPNVDIELFKETMNDAETGSLVTQMNRLIGQDIYKAYFKLADTNRNRKVEASELRALYTAIARKVFVGDDELTKYIRDIDALFDGSISSKQYYQFKGFVNRLHVAYARATSIDADGLAAYIESASLSLDTQDVISSLCTAISINFASANNRTLNYFGDDRQQEVLIKAVANLQMIPKIYDLVKGKNIDPDFLSADYDDDSYTQTAENVCTSNQSRGVKQVATCEDFGKPQECSDRLWSGFPGCSCREPISCLDLEKPQGNCSDRLWADFPSCSCRPAVTCEDLGKAPKGSCSDRLWSPFPACSCRPAVTCEDLGKQPQGSCSNRLWSSFPNCSCRAPTSCLDLEKPQGSCSNRLWTDFPSCSCRPATTCADLGKRSKGSCSNRLWTGFPTCSCRAATSCADLGRRSQGSCSWRLWSGFPSCSCRSARSCRDLGRSKGSCSSRLWTDFPSCTCRRASSCSDLGKRSQGSCSWRLWSGFPSCSCRAASSCWDLGISTSCSGGSWRGFPLCFCRRWSD